MGLWRSSCPVREVEQLWIEESMDWMVTEFGRRRLLREVVLPTDQYFPGAYQGSRDDVAGVLAKLCAQLGVDEGRVELEFDDSAEDGSADLSAEVDLHSESHGAAGLYHGGGRIAIRSDLARRPMALVATIAHELGHLLLLGDGRITPDRKDHEPLTDLLVVYCGLGIFAANAAFEYGREARGQRSYYTTSRLGYLTEPMYGYALARYAWLRGERKPDWARYLDTNPRAVLKSGLRYLHQVGSGLPVAGQP
jgi:hypothetical protein